VVGRSSSCRLPSSCPTASTGVRHPSRAGVALAAQAAAVRADSSCSLLVDIDADGIPDHLDEQPGSAAR
jgi:hypothetical protein